MRDSHEIIRDMREFVMPYIAKQLEKEDFEGQGELDQKEFSEEFGYILDLAQKGANQAADGRTNKTVMDVIDDLEKQMMMTGAESIDLSFAFEHRPYIFGVRLIRLDDEEVPDD